VLLVSCGTFKPRLTIWRDAAHPFWAMETGCGQICVTPRHAQCHTGTHGHKVSWATTVGWGRHGKRQPKIDQRRQRNTAAPSVCSSPRLEPRLSFRSLSRWLSPEGADFGVTGESVDSWRRPRRRQRLSPAAEDFLFVRIMRARSWREDTSWNSCAAPVSPSCAAAPVPFSFPARWFIRALESAACALIREAVYS
jgi:hypothetical protein